MDNQYQENTFAIDDRAIYTITCSKCRRKGAFVAGSFDQFVSYMRAAGWVGKRVMNSVCPECIADIENTPLRDDEFQSWNDEPGYY